MNKLQIEHTEDTPKVILSKEEGLFEISGRSLPEDATSFYAPILSWLEEYSKDENDSTIFKVNLEYFNTASSKLILDVFTQLEDLKNIKVQWFFHDDDEDMEEAGEEFSEIIDIDFELIPV